MEASVLFSKARNWVDIFPFVIKVSSVPVNWKGDEASGAIADRFSQVPRGRSLDVLILLYVTCAAKFIRLIAVVVE